MMFDGVGLEMTLNM